MINSVDVLPVAPFENTVMRGSPNFSANGEFLAASCSDGRGLLFDGSGKVLWQRELSKPTQIDDAWINASGRDGFAVDAGVIFTTINTFNRENWRYLLLLSIPAIIVCLYLIMMERLSINIRLWGQWSRLIFLVI